MIEDFKHFFDKKTIVTIVIAIVTTIIISYLRPDNNFLLFYGKGNVHIEYDKCIDSLDSQDFLDKAVFKPKKPRYLVIHTTDSKKDQTEADLWVVFRSRWGKDTKPGYNYAVNMSGKVYYFAPIDNSPFLEWDEIVYGVKGFNSTTINIAYVGGYGGKDTRTQYQKNSLDMLVRHVKTIFPDIIVLGHRDMPNVKKTCPNFNVASEYASI